MSGFKGTPGPWVVNGCRVEGDDGALIAGVFDGAYSQVTDRETEDANARLIAAAPELLGALQYLMAIADRSGRERYIQFQLTPEFLEPARTAIAKALGEDK